MSTGVYNMTARQAMTRRVDTIGPNESIHCALEKMVTLGLTALPVVNDESQCVGVLTKTDIITLVGALDEDDRMPVRRDLAALYFGVPIDELTKSKVEDVMTTRVVSASPNQPLASVAKAMLQHEVHHVPVCDDQNQVIGVISSMDLIKSI